MVLFKIGLPDDASALFSELALHTLLRAVVVSAQGPTQKSGVSSLERQGIVVVH